MVRLPSKPAVSCELAGFTACAMAGKDFYSCWPCFDGEELSRRLSRSSPERATLMTKANLLTWADIDYSGFETWCLLRKELSWQHLAGKCADVLQSVGIGDSVVRATLSIDRSRFVPEQYAGLAFLNMSLPLAPASNATMFGLSALVTDAIARLRSEHVIEIGFGSGLTAAGIICSCDSIRSYEGYEADASLKALWHAGAATDARLEAITSHWTPFEIGSATLREGSLLLFSCAVDFDAYETLRRRLSEVPRSACIVPRPLLAAEFGADGKSPINWHGKAPADYAEYMQNPRKYMVLELLESSHIGLASTLVCSNIQYIAYQHEATRPVRPESFSFGALNILLQH